MKKLLLGAIMIAMMASCSHKWGSTYTAGTSTMSSTKVKEKATTTESSGPTETNRVKLPATGGATVNFLPNATAFRMSGDYSNNVAVTLNSNGELLYFPAPTDITADSRPVEIGDGWWLNCQGLGPHSVFTKYTFAEYAELPEAPTPEQLKMAILPGAVVTEFMELPVKLNEALKNPQAVKNYLK
ncbi:MAG: hypothetical protein J1D77_06900 [Muribaculaceae bacterium]|nr:hypothetical protein [Muribaculaceae bacterium]